MLQLILNNEKFSTMENNPLHSKDATFGIPKKYYDILQEIQQDDESLGERTPKIEMKLLRIGIGPNHKFRSGHQKQLSMSQHQHGKYNHFNDKIFNFESDEYDEEEYYDECGNESLVSYEM